MRIIDVSEIKQYYDLYRTIAITMQFPEEFGHSPTDFPSCFCQNADALWDCLTDICEEETVVLRGFGELPQSLQETGRLITETFLAAEKQMSYFHVMIES